MTRSRRNNHAADLDITAFMNLMIVLVPVLLLNMVFTHIRVINLQLPELTERIEQTDKTDTKQLELIVRKDHIHLNYPAGQLLKAFKKEKGRYPFEDVQNYLKQIKSTLQQQSQENKRILILPESNTSYQVVVQLMDTVKSYPSVVATSVVDAELFPDIAFGDAP